VKDMTPRESIRTRAARYLATVTPRQRKLRAVRHLKCALENPDYDLDDMEYALGLAKRACREQAQALVRGDR